MDRNPIEARGEFAAKELCHNLAPTCRSCPMRGIFVETTQDLVNDGVRVHARLHCGATPTQPCPDELKPKAKDEEYMLAAKDFGMARRLRNNNLARQSLIPAMEFEMTEFRAMDKGALEEYLSKVIDHALLEADEDVINQWWDLLDHLGGLKHSWHGPEQDNWESAKRKYLTDHLVEAKRAELHGSSIMPTEYMVKNLPEELRRPFVMGFPKDMRPGRVVHPGSRPSEKKYAPPPPPKYHNWGTWGS